MCVQNDPVGSVDQDIVSEKQRIISGDADGDAIRIEGLRKVYNPNSKNKKVAVKDLWLGIPAGQVLTC